VRHMGIDRSNKLHQGDSKLQGVTNKSTTLLPVTSKKKVKGENDDPQIMHQLAGLSPLPWGTFLSLTCTNTDDMVHHQEPT
jgi:hypothetical protein